MAEKSFGVKEINLIGASGTPTIESPNNLNLNAVNVAISTNATIGGNLTVSGTVGIAGTLTYEDVTNVDAVGIITAREGISLPDSKNARFGTDNDAIIYHNGNHLFIKEQDAGQIFIDGAAGVTLQMAGTTRIATQSDGGYVTGNLGVSNKISAAFVNIGSNIQLGNAGVITATNFSGNGSSLTALNGSNITSGTVAAARVATLNQDTTGNAGTFTVTANNSTNETVYPVFVDGATGSQGAETDTGLNYNPSTGRLTAVSYAGDGSALTGISGGVDSDSSQNTVGGSNAGDSIVSGGTENTVFGYNAGTAISTGDNNTFFGSRAGRSISTGLQNTGVGYNVMGNASGTGNAALGQSAGNGMSSGSYNVALGWSCFSNVSSNGSNNIVIGKQAEISATNVSNEITLGNDDINHLRVPGIGVSFSEGGAVISGITTAKEGVFIPENKEIKLGNTAADPDFKIYNDSGSSYVHSTQAGAYLRIKSAGGIVMQQGTSQNCFFAAQSGKTSLYYAGNEKIETTNTGVTVTGTCVATTFSGSGANLTGIAVTEAPVTDYTISANGSSAYRIHGGGVDETANNPDLYLIRGQKYRFNNTTGSNHPFAIRASSGGSAYTDGVSGDDEGVQFFTVPYAAPASLVYQCTIHGGMVGNIYIRGGSSTVVVSNNANNRIITGSGTANTLEAETTLEWDGTNTLTSVNQGSGYPDFRVNLKTVAGGGSFEAFRADGNGRFRIGSQSTTANSSADELLIGNGSNNRGLTIFGGTSNIYFGDSSDNDIGKLEYDHSDDSMRFTTNTEERLRITSSGLLGLGLSNPARQFHQHIDSSAANYHSFTNSTTGSSNTDGLLVGLTSNEEAIFWNYENTDLRFATNSTERLRIDSSGRLLVGTITQFGDGNDKLMIENGTTGGRLTFGSSAGFAEPIIGQMSAYWADNKKVAAISFFGGSDTTNKDDGTIRFATSSANNLTERLRITSDGNVGINATNPTTALEVKGDITVYNANNQGDIFFGEHGDVSDSKALIRMDQSSSTAGELQFHTEGGGTLTKRVTISSDGTTTFDPSAGGTLKIGGSSAHTSKIVIADNAGSGNGNCLIEGGDGTDFFTIQSNGNVRFENGKGINFDASAGSGASSNLLDEYEEGTWTPTVKFGNNSATVTATGKYTRIGNLVHITYQVSITNLSGSSGNISVGSLPYTPSQSPTYSHGIVQGNSNKNLPSNAGSTMAYIETNQTQFRILYDTPTVHGDVNHTMFDVNTTFYGNGTYFTAT